MTHGATSPAFSGPLPGGHPDRPLGSDFFDRDAQVVACDLLGKVIRHEVGGFVLMAAIVETEAYYLTEKASHASLGYTEKRKPLFMPPGTIYMYYARGGDSFNVSCAGEGNAVLIKAGVPFPAALDPARDAALDAVPGSGAEPSGENTGNSGNSESAMIAEMRRRNPLSSGKRRPLERLCSGQTLLCRALGLRVPVWSGIAVDTPPLSLLDVGYRPTRVARTTRMGIPEHRDGHLPYRFVDAAFALQATKNPFSSRPGGGGSSRKPMPPGVRELAVPSGGESVDWELLLRQSIDDPARKDAEKGVEKERNGVTPRHDGSYEREELFVTPGDG